MEKRPLVSVIIPIHNGENWIKDCFESIFMQDILKKETVEISVFDDASTDNTKNLLSEWQKKISFHPNLTIIISQNFEKYPKGVGYAKNKAVLQSNGKYLCFQDVDDVMLPRRISAQLQEAEKNPDALIGCQVKRMPENSTPRLTAWANNLSQDLLSVQIYTSHGPTVLMPTWFISRKAFDRVGAFSEKGKGTPEDLLFFYSYLNGTETVRRVDEVLLLYRYHPACTTFSVPEERIWNIRINYFEKRVLSKWSKFTIWNAGKQGRRFYRSLTMSNRKKVIQFCDVDPKKTGKFYEPYSRSEPYEGRKIPIVHFSKAQPPFVTCVKLDMTNGVFEFNLKSLNLVEGRDFFVFS